MHICKGFNHPLMAYPNMYLGTPSSVNCTPHFKPDAEKPWVTRESPTFIHYWFNPEKEQTLIEVVEQIEAWIHYDWTEIWPNRRYMRENPLGYMTAHSMEIRGVKYTREELANKTTRENFRNEEPFTLRFNPGREDVGPSTSSCRIN